jgi:hypothetical protein
MRIDHLTSRTAFHTSNAIIALVLAFALHGTAYSADQTKLIESAKTHVKDQLKDPASAQFKNVVVRVNAGPNRVTVVCGRVNSKNSFGGYTGFTRFFWSPVAEDAIVEESFPDAAFFESSWRNVCQ